MPCLLRQTGTRETEKDGECWTSDKNQDTLGVQAPEGGMHLHITNIDPSRQR